MNTCWSASAQDLKFSSTFWPSTAQTSTYLPSSANRHRLPDHSAQTIPPVHCEGLPPQTPAMDATDLSPGAAEDTFDATLLDRIPVDALRCIFRNMSSRPGYARWMDCLSFADVNGVYCGMGAVAELCRQVLCNLATQDAIDRGERPGHVRVSRDDLSRALAAGAASIKSLVLGALPVESLSAVAQCSALTHLDVAHSHPRYGFGDFFKSLPGSLSSLSISRDLSLSEFNDIASHCGSLRRLAMQDVTATADPFPHFDNMVLASDLAPFFTIIGPSLEHLSVTRLRSSQLLLYVKKHCRRLTSTRLSVGKKSNRALNDQIVDVLLSYTTQLRQARFGGMERAQLEAVMQGCPEANFTADCDSATVADVMAGLGGRLVKLVVGDSGRYMHSRELDAMRDGAARCSRLEAIAFEQTVGRRTMEAMLLSGELESLRSLSVGSMSGLVGPGGPSDLRELRYNGFTSIGQFKQFARANPQLETVEVISQLPKGMYGDDEVLETAEQVEKTAVDVFEAFVVCRMLRELYIGAADSANSEHRLSVKTVSRLREIQDADKRFMFRPANVRIFGTFLS